MHRPNANGEESCGQGKSVTFTPTLSLRQFVKYSITAIQVFFFFADIKTKNVTVSVDWTYFFLY